MKLLRKLDDKFTGMGIRKVRAVTCVYNGLSALLYLLLSRMGVPFADFFFVAFGVLAIVFFVIWYMTPQGMPMRNNLND